MWVWYSHSCLLLHSDLQVSYPIISPPPPAHLGPGPRLLQFPQLLREVLRQCILDCT